VDSKDKERIAESRDELFKILQNDEMRGVPVVVIANKQDLPSMYNYCIVNLRYCLSLLKTTLKRIFFFLDFYRSIVLFFLVVIPSRYMCIIILSVFTLYCTLVQFFSLYLTDAQSTSQVADQMCLHKLTTRKWFIQSACATTGEGIYEAIDKLSSMVKDYKKGLK
jgi:signal recognition particle receptor subunit beta